MQPRYFEQRCRTLMSTFLLLMLSWSIAHAQAVTPPVRQSSDYPPAPPCVGCYKGFVFDSVFRMGAHFNGAWKGAPQFLKDTLHIGITQMYGQPYLHEFFYPTDTSDARTNWVNGVRRQFWRDVQSADLKVILQPGNVSAIAKGSEMSEAYFGQATSDTVHRIDFTDHGPNIGIDRRWNGFYWGGKFPRATSDTLPMLMAGGPQWTAMGIAQSGYYLASQIADTGKYDLAVALKVDTNATAFSSLGSDSLIAFVKMYRRIPVGQTLCGCNLYEYIDSLPITKGVYLDTSVSDPRAGDGYRDVTFSFDISEPTFAVSTPLDVEITPLDIVRALDTGTYAKYEPRGGFTGWHPEGNYHGGSDSTSRYARYCRGLRDSLVAHNYYGAASMIDRFSIVNSGDFGYEVYTTRKVDITLLRGRLSPHTYTLLRHGAYDDTIRKSIDAVFNDTTLGGAMNAQMFRFGVVDEHAPEKYRGYMDVASRVQRAILAHDSTDTRGIWVNPQRDGPSIRVFSGDLDTTAIRMLPMSANQWYNYGGLIPVAYADPDSMNGSAALTSLYKASGSGRTILYNTSDDYLSYLAQSLKASSERIDQLAQMINASRFMFRHIRREPYPVYSVVQVHGYLNGGDGGYAKPPSWFFPIITPEEITVQSWLALNTGVDGLWFSDFTYDDAREFGVMHWLNGADSLGRVDSLDYRDSLYSGDPFKQGDTNWVLPKMWTGFNSRYHAVKRVTDDFAGNIIPVYEKLDHNGIRMHVWTGSLFADMPMLDTLYTMQAARLKVGGAYQPLVDTIGAQIDTVYDRKDSTFMVATLFSPGPADSNRLSRYLVLTNMRCWPYDEKHYSSYVSTFHTTDTVGFGAIDARRPVVVLKNSLGVVADSVRVQRIGDTTSTVVAFGDTLRLDWLDPGWGAMYRITPIAKPISTLGTAYNNAVHSLNPSANDSAHDRIVVYERDSVVYLRAMDAKGKWGPEHRISDSIDITTVTVGGVSRNKADNLFPAIDMVRSGGSSCAIVWERRTNPGNQMTVEMAWLPWRPTTTSFPPSDSIIRRRLSRPRQFSQSWMQLTPAVVGVDSGYVVAWAAADYMTEVKAVRDRPDSAHQDTSRVLRVKMVPTPPRTLDSAMGYPTLAYTRNWQEVALNGGLISGPNDTIAFTTVAAHVPGVPDTMGSYHIAHLAYQQGPRSGTAPFYIMYNRIGVRFPVRAVGIPEIWASPTEEASYNVSGCNRIYPSIAVDSVHVGVTFTVISPPASTGYTCLRFRDMTTNTPTALRWNTTLYTWGGRQGGGTVRSYERSSVTMFPSRDTTNMNGAFEGGMTWHWTNPPNSRQNGVKVYRFGEYAADSLLDGQHPTMTLVPRVGDSASHAMKSTGVFRRGAVAEKFQMLDQRSQPRWYYPGYYDNNPAGPLVLFSRTPPTRQIHAEGTVTRKNPLVDCSTPPSATFTTTVILSPVPPDYGPPPDTAGGPGTTPPWNEWGMPPTFFPRTPVWGKAVTTIGDLGKITRTPSFPADTSTATITRIIAGSDSLMDWLNGQPNDTIYGIPANIFCAMEIVRDSDDVVLWQGDTISARGVGADTVTQTVSLPIGSVASSGEMIYIRLAAMPTNGMSYDLNGDFHFVEDTASSGGSSARRTIAPDVEAVPTTGKAIGVTMIPNPLHTATGELRVRTTVPGTTRVSIYDIRGSKVMALPPIEVERAGEYAIPLDLSALADGVYIVEVRSGDVRGSTRVTLVR